MKNLFAVVFLLASPFFVNTFEYFRKDEPYKKAETYFGRTLREETADDSEPLIASLRNRRVNVQPEAKFIASQDASNTVFDNFQNSGPYDGYDYQDYDYYFYNMGYPTVSKPVENDKIRQTYYPDFKGLSKELHKPGFNNGFNSGFDNGFNGRFYNGFNDGFYKN